MTEIEFEGIHRVRHYCIAHKDEIEAGTLLSRDVAILFKTSRQNVSEIIKSLNITIPHNGSQILCPSCKKTRPQVNGKHSSVVLCTDCKQSKQTIKLICSYCHSSYELTGLKRSTYLSVRKSNPKIKGSLCPDCVKTYGPGILASDKWRKRNVPSG